MDFLVEPFAVDPGKFAGPVLVTGAGGCLGAWTLAILEKSGIPAVACDLSDSRARPALVMGEEKAAALTWELCDISDAERLIAIVSEHGIRAIIHYAGLQVPLLQTRPGAGRPGKCRRDGQCAAGGPRGGYQTDRLCQFRGGPRDAHRR